MGETEYMNIFATFKHQRYLHTTHVIKQFHDKFSSRQIFAYHFSVKTSKQNQGWQIYATSHFWPFYAMAKNGMAKNIT